MIRRTLSTAFVLIGSSLSAYTLADDSLSFSAEANAEMVPMLQAEETAKDYEDTISLNSLILAEAAEDLLAELDLYAADIIDTYGKTSWTATYVCGGSYITVTKDITDEVNVGSYTYSGSTCELSGNLAFE